MKKLSFLLLVISWMATAQAQEGEIIYRDFEPDLFVGALTYPYPLDTIKVDIDQDGTDDFALFMGMRSGMIMGHYANYSPWYFRFKVGENDTIIPGERWFTSNGHPNEITFYDDESPTIVNDTFGFRKIVDGETYYAWMSVEVTKEPQAIHNYYGVYDKIRAYIKEVAYCSIPDYPLCWGQTSLTEDLEENESTAFAAVHPNPTTGLVRIFGQDLKAAEVVNILGQRVAAAKGEGETLQLDISHLPAGVYFVSVTDNKGRKCVRKVVKE